jgi:hypothetical protein
MSMGRFEGASEQTLNALRNITLDEHKTMATPHCSEWGVWPSLAVHKNRR